MGDASQQQTLSVRISDSLRERLERARELEMVRTGQPVSVSEVAKKMLESGREDRLEVVHLLSTPTATLAQIRRKREAGYVLTRAEWTVVSHFVREGMESFSSVTPTALSTTSILTVIDAFEALVVEGGSSDPVRNRIYLENLALEEPHAGPDMPVVTDEWLHRSIVDARHRIVAHSAWRPLPFARNLCVFLEDETAVTATTIDRVLRKHWEVLWRIVARGHYARTGRPVRECPVARIHVCPSVPPITDGCFTLSVVVNEPAELSLLIGFPGPRGPRYPISGYPRVSEFFTMLAALGGSGGGSLRRWHGHFFVGDRIAAGNEQEVWFRGTEDGISVGFSLQEWTAVQSLAERALNTPDVAMTWTALARDYGEL